MYLCLHLSDSVSVSLDISSFTYFKYLRFYVSAFFLSVDVFSLASCLHTCTQSTQASRLKKIGVATSMIIDDWLIYHLLILSSRSDPLVD